jgi:hypothetical protein
MPYKFVNVRFNTDKEEEKILYEKLNSRNRAGNIKDIMKKFFLLDDENLMRKVELKSLIKEVLDNEVNIENEKIISSSKNIVKINLNGREHIL